MVSEFDEASGKKRSPSQPEMDRARKLHRLASESRNPSEARVASRHLAAMAEQMNLDAEELSKSSTVTSLRRSNVICVDVLLLAKAAILQNCATNGLRCPSASCMHVVAIIENDNLPLGAGKLQHPIRILYTASSRKPVEDVHLGIFTCSIPVHWYVLEEL